MIRFKGGYYGKLIKNVENLDDSPIKSVKKKKKNKNLFLFSKLIKKDNIEEEEDKEPLINIDLIPKCLRNLFIRKKFL